MLTFHKIVDRLVGAGIFIAGIGITFFVCLVNVEVFRRYMLNDPTMWAMEISTYMLVLFVYGAMAYALKVDGHVSIDLVYLRLNKRYKKICDIANTIITFIFWTLVAWHSFKVALQALMQQHRSSTLLGVPLVYPLMLVTIGAFLVCLQSVSIFLRKFDHKTAEE